MTGKIVSSRRDGHIGEIVFDNPASDNAITSEMAVQFCDAISAFEQDNDIKVIVIAGAGPNLTSGSDLPEIAARFPKRADGARQRPINQRVRFNAANLWWGANGVFRRVLHCQKVTILAAQGLCLEAGLYLAAYCDLTIAADTARFGNPQWRHVGVNGDISMLIAAVGLKRVKDLVYAGAIWDAQEAMANGLIDAVVPAEKHMTAVANLAHSCAMIMRDAVAGEKQVLVAALARMQVDTGFGAAGVLGGWSTNIHFRDGEFNFLREMRQDGLKDAMHKSEDHFKSD